MQRVRDKTALKSSTGYATHYAVDGSVSSGPTAYPVSVSEADTMIDTVTPGFARRSGMGEIFINPMDKVKCQVGFAQYGSEWTRSDGVRAVYSGDWDYGLGSFDPNTLSSVETEKATGVTLAVTSAYASVGSPDVATLTELIELRETLSFLASPVKGMVNLTRRFQRHLKRVEGLNARYAQRLAKWNALPPRVQLKRAKPEPPELPTFKVGKLKGTDISSSWLAYRYGLMPLIYTFQDVEKLLKKRLEGPVARATARAKDERTVDIKDQVTFTDVWGPSSFQQVVDTVGQVKITTRAGVLYEPDFSLSSQLGFQWNRVPAALYEGIPLSFVSDWFHNGSNLYDALTAEFRAMKILGAWVTQEVELTVTRTSTTIPIANVSILGDKGVQVASGKWKTRRPATLSDVGFKFRTELNGKRIADGLALIHTFLATARKK